MISNINGSNAMQQMQQLRNGQGPHGHGQGQGMHKGLGQIMQSLPQDSRENLSNTLQSMDESQRKDVVSKLKELDVANLSQEDLMNQVNKILNPKKVATTDSNFSIYA